jgi:hypothetical protein
MDLLATGELTEAKVVSGLAHCCRGTHAQAGGPFDLRLVVGPYNVLPFLTFATCSPAGRRATPLTPSARR